MRFSSFPDSPSRRSAVRLVGRSVGRFIIRCDCRKPKILVAYFMHSCAVPAGLLWKYYMWKYTYVCVCVCEAICTTNCPMNTWMLTLLITLWFVLALLENFRVFAAAPHAFLSLVSFLTSRYSFYFTASAAVTTYLSFPCTVCLSTCMYYYAWVILMRSLINLSLIYKTTHHSPLTMGAP